MEEEAESIYLGNHGDGEANRPPLHKEKVGYVLDQRKGQRRRDLNSWPRIRENH